MRRSDPSSPGWFTRRTHLEVFDGLHGPGVDLQLVQAEPPFQQFLVREFEGDFFVSSHSHRGLELFKSPPHWTTKRGNVDILTFLHYKHLKNLHLQRKAMTGLMYLMIPALWPWDTAPEYCRCAVSFSFTMPSYSWPSITLKFKKSILILISPRTSGWVIS